MIVLVASVDSYADVRSPFAQLYRKFWEPKSPWPIHGISNVLEWPNPIMTVPVGADQGWCRNLIMALDLLCVKFVLLLQEDYLPTDPPDWGYLEKAYDWISNHPEIGCFRVMPCSGVSVAATGFLHDSGPLPIVQPYWVSTQAAIWRVSVLRDLLSRFRTGQEFELEGSKLAGQLKTEFVSTVDGFRPLPYIVTGVVNGRWIRGAIDWMKQNGIEPDLTRRGTW